MNNKHIHFSWNPIHPRRDWKRLLIAFGVLLLAVVGWSAYLMFSSEKIDPSSLQPSEKGDSNKARLEAISSYFEER